MNSIRKFNAGDKVMIDPDVAGKWTGVVFTFGRYLTSNVDLVAPDGSRLRAPAEFLIEATPEAVAHVEAVPVLPVMWPGAVARIRGRDGLWVVLALSGQTYRLARLGSTDGRYVRNITRAALTEVPLSELGL